MQIKAAIVGQRSGPFAIDTVELCAPRPDEVIVRVVASGMCQTDLHSRDGYYANPYPSVFGHEGAGVVHAVGSAVRSLAPGDHVVMSFPWCGDCANCEQDMHSYCVHAFPLKMQGTRADGSTLLSKDGKPVYSAFFQQSSFGTYALTQERYAVKVRKDAPLELLGPLACSGQTGAGAVLNVIKPARGDSFAVFGVGAVGLSALMAAKIAGCDPIIAVDVHDHRLALARELGATHTIDKSARQRRRRRDPHHHRKRRALIDRYVGGAGGVSRGDRGADARRHLRAARQRAPRQRSRLRDAVPAGRPQRSRRHPG